MPKRELIGSIFTDVAAVVVGDPCKLVHDTRDRKPPYTYGQYCERWAEANPRVVPEYVPGEGLKWPDVGPHKWHTDLGESRGVAVATLENCDGWCDVYVE